MDQPKTERILRLMQLLASNVNYSIEELMDKLDMSRRTIYRYLDTFKEAGFAVQKVGGVYKLATLRTPNMDLSKIVYFSDEEAYVVNRLIDQLDNTNAMKQGLKRKLTAVYDATNIGNYTDHKANSANIEALTEAVRSKCAVLLKGYSSSHSGETKDYRVEPFKFNTNYIDFWAYDLADGVNKRFKLSRVDDVKVLDKEPWRFEDAHEAEPMDAFRMHGVNPSHVKLELNYIAKNLLLEEYPLAEEGLSQEGDHWIWEGDVNRIEGVGRFVLGLPTHIKVLEGEELKQFLRNSANYILSL